MMRGFCPKERATVDYSTIKTVHVASVVASYLLFTLRGWWMLRGSDMLAERWVRIVPHVVDTVLLASAVTLAVLIRQYPLEAPWITAKVTGLVAYIALGTIALKRGRTLRVRLAALVAAQAVFFYIVAVAVTKSPWPPA
jgi:uncharacterized membrane protein SirB2